MREDLKFPIIQGNKWRKLKYNIQRAKDLNIKNLLSFGGAYSNHIAALSRAGKKYNLNTIGVIRGEQILPLNATLKEASENGMKLHFVSRRQYKDKENSLFLSDLLNRFGAYYLIPEGGTNELAIKGCEEIISEIENHFEADYYCLPVGTGGTISGVVSALKGRGEVIGFSSLKGNFLQGEVEAILTNYNANIYKNYSINNDFHFGGYAKFSKELIDFINYFNEEFKILLDPIYTGKMMFGLMEMIKNNKFEKGKKILAIHTGGLQGIKGFNERFEHKIII